jgi:hypothetical protein
MVGAEDFFALLVGVAVGLRVLAAAPPAVAAQEALLTVGC